jgi:hypothetical protein
MEINMTKRSIAFDLVDEMNWEDVADELGLFLSLEDAGFEEANDHCHGKMLSNEGSIYSYTEWFYDGDESAFSIA